jgi:hypothetical protein
LGHPDEDGEVSAFLLLQNLITGTGFHNGTGNLITEMAGND